MLCQTATASEERYGASFMETFNSTEGNGMGESTTFYSVGARSLNNNPAGLVFLNGSELLINFYRYPRTEAFIMKENDAGNWMDYGKYDIEPFEMNSISYALGLGKIGNIGLSFALNHKGRFIRVNKDGKAVNSFPNDDMLVTFGYGHNLFGGVSFGFDIKSIRSKILFNDKNEIGRTSIMSVGLMHQMGNRARAGVSLQNIGKDLSYNVPDIPSKIRRRILVGGMYDLVENRKNRLSISMDFSPPFENGLRYYTGAEFSYLQLLSVRLGYINNIETYYNPLVNLANGEVGNEERLWIRKGLTFGLGASIKGNKINFALMPYRKPDLNSDEKLRIEEKGYINSFSFSREF